MLHILSNKKITSYNHCQQCMQAHDSVLLIAEAVYFILDINITKNILNNSTAKNIRFYALSDDVAARGITDKIPSFIQLINYDEFVQLTELCNRNQTW